MALPERMMRRTESRAIPKAREILRLPWPCTCRRKIAVRVSSSSMVGSPVRSAG